MVQRIRRFIPALFILGFALTAVLSAPAHAADTQSQAITVSPASTELSVNPGESASKSFDVINSGADTFSVSLSSSPYHVTGENYDPQFTQLPGTVDASAWVKLSATNETVKGYKLLTVPYTIDVPANTAPGGYYAVIFAETSTDDTKTGVVSHNRVGNILYITVNGDIKTGGSYVADGISPLHFAGPVTIGSKVSNSGGTHFITTVKYSVTDNSGNTVFKYSADKYVLPQTEREFSTSWSPQTLFNIYTVHRSATIAGKLTTLPDQKVVVINPWLLIGVAFLLGILIGVPLQRARQRRRAKDK